MNASKEAGDALMKFIQRQAQDAGGKNVQNFSDAFTDVCIKQEDIDMRNAHIDAMERSGYIEGIKDRKDLTGKHSPLLMPREADIAYSLVSDNGLEVYKNRNTWQENEPRLGLFKYADAAIRHLKDAVQKEDIDTKSSLPHVYHALWNTVAAVWHYERLHGKATEFKRAV